MYSGLKVHFDDATSHQKLYLLVVYCWKCIIDGKNADTTDKFIYLSGVCNFAHWRDDVKYWLIVSRTSAYDNITVWQDTVVMTVWRGWCGLLMGWWRLCDSVTSVTTLHLLSVTPAPPCISHTASYHPPPHTTPLTQHLWQLTTN